MVALAPKPHCGMSGHSLKTAGEPACGDHECCERDRHAGTRMTFPIDLDATTPRSGDYDDIGGRSDDEHVAGQCA